MLLKILEGQEKINDRLDDMDKRLDRMETRIEEIESKIKITWNAINYISDNTKETLLIIHKACQ